jgi:hypothetical protein
MAPFLSAMRFQSVFVAHILPLLPQEERQLVSTVCRPWMEWSRLSPLRLAPCLLTSSQVDDIVASLRSLQLPWCEATCQMAFYFF